MKKLLITLIVAAGLYCAYWFGVRAAAPAQLIKSLDTQRAQGLDIRFAPLKIGGFPHRFESEIAGLTIAQTIAPRWEAKLENAHFTAPAYWPTKQTLTHSGTGQITVAISDSAVAAFNTHTQNLTINSQSLGQKSMTLEGKTISLTPVEGSLGEGFALRSIEAVHITSAQTGTAQALTLEAKAISLDMNTLGQIGKALGGTVTSLEADVNYSLETSQYGGQQLSSLNIPAWALSWGHANMQGAANLSRNQGGLQGSLDIDIDNSAALLSKLKEVGILSSQEYFTINLMLGANEKTRSIKFTVKDSALYLGPMHLMQLPL